MKTYRDLIVWQKSMSLVMMIYAETKGFPKEEDFGLTSQIQRSAVSIPAILLKDMDGTAQTIIYDFYKLHLVHFMNFKHNLKLAID